MFVPPSLTKHFNVHIADTDSDFSANVCSLLHHEGFNASFSLMRDQFEVAVSDKLIHFAFINLRMGNTFGLELMAQLKQKYFGTPVYILSDINDGPTAVEAMKAGAKDVLFKPVRPVTLAKLVRQALASNVAVVRSRGKMETKIHGVSTLSPRERQVLNLIMSGLNNRQIAERFGKSPRTVEVHRAHIKDKLGATNTADLVRLASYYM